MGKYQSRPEDGACEIGGRRVPDLAIFAAIAEQQDGGDIRRRHLRRDARENVDVFSKLTDADDAHAFETAGFFGDSEDRPVVIALDVEDKRARALPHRLQQHRVHCRRGLALTFATKDERVLADVVIDEADALPAPDTREVTGGMKLARRRAHVDDQPSVGGHDPSQAPATRLFEIRLLGGDSECNEWYERRTKPIPRAGIDRGDRRCVRRAAMDRSVLPMRQPGLSDAPGIERREPAQTVERVIEVAENRVGQVTAGTCRDRMCRNLADAGCAGSERSSSADAESNDFL